MSGASRQVIAQRQAINGCSEYYGALPPFDTIKGAACSPKCQCAREALAALQAADPTKGEGGERG